MRRPTIDQLQIVLLWLDGNEGEGEEREACEATIEWIEHLIEASVRNSVKRQIKKNTPQPSAKEAQSP